MQIKKMKLNNLKPAPYNPRVDLVPGMEEYEKLKRSLIEFGFVDTPIFNKQTGYLVGGHQRVAVAKELGLCDEIEVSVVDLSIDKEKALNLALNKISGHWDEEKLAVLLKELNIEDVLLSGFDEDETNNIFEKFQYEQDIEKVISEDDFKVDEEIKKITKPETNYGDIWQLGRHRLMCGDSTKIEDIDQLMNNKKADLVITDPPYNVAVESENEELIESGRDKILNDSMSDEDFNNFLLQIFKSYDHLMSNNSGIYVFHPASYQREFENAMNENNLFVRSQCIWVKNNATFGWSQYRWQHEPCFYAYKKNNVPSWYGNRKQSTVWEDDLIDDISSVWRVTRDDVNKYYHPTQKPLSLLAIPLRNSSTKDDLIVDLFGGSGSTMIICEELDRDCYTMELDPIFCDVIKNRYEALTGINPILLNK